MHRLEAPQMADYREFCALATDKIPSDFLDGLAAMGMPVEVVHGGHDESFGRERLIEIADDYVASRG
jgi:hypothetical protein